MRRFAKILACSLVMALVSITTTGCYSFTGSSLSPEIKSMYIEPIENRTAYNPELSFEFTNNLLDRFESRAGLTQDEQEPHIRIGGEIVGYQLSSQNITADQVAAQNRLTITVNIRYQNSIEPEKSFTRNFSNFADFDASVDVLSFENSAQVEDITSNIIDKIFNAIVADW